MVLHIFSLGMYSTVPVVLVYSRYEVLEDWYYLVLCTSTRVHLPRDNNIDQKRLQLKKKNCSKIFSYQFETQGSKWTFYWVSSKQKFGAQTNSSEFRCLDLKSWFWFWFRRAETIFQLISIIFTKFESKYGRNFFIYDQINFEILMLNPVLKK
jgi:hypothetical protein